MGEGEGVGEGEGEGEGREGGTLKKIYKQLPYWFGALRRSWLKT